MDEIDQAVIAAVAASAKAAPEEIRPDAALDALGIDSLEFVVVVQAVEEALDVQLPDDLTAAADTVADLIAISRAAKRNGRTT